MYHLISMATARYISFNISLLPETLGIVPTADGGDSGYRIAEALPGGKTRTLDDAEIESGIMAYLEDYVRHYRNIFGDEPPFGETRKNILRFIGTRSCGRRTEA